MSNIELKITGPVARLTVDRPEKLNAITPAMLNALEECVRRIEADMEVRVVVMHGAGKTFSVGADINVWSELTTAEFRTHWIDNGHRAFNAIAHCRQPVIAAMHGMAFGGGLELALAADLRIAEEGTLLALPEVSLGTVPGWGGTQRLPEIVGRSRAKQMILAAERIEAARAESWGLVNRTCAPGTGLDTALEMAGKVAALAPVSVQIAKRIIDGTSQEGLGATMEMLGGMAAQSTRDMSEGISALREKRTPQFTGA